MIDKNGNKLPNPNSQEVDFPLLELEIRFLRDGFLEKPGDDIGYLLAQKLQVYAKERPFSSEQEEILAAFDAHAPHSRSEDFLWEVVRVYRELCKKNECMSKWGEYRLRSARLFDHICNVVPTPHNRSCRVLEYLKAAERLKKENGSLEQQIIDLLTTAKAGYEAIPPVETETYHYAGRQLYTHLFCQHPLHKGFNQKGRLTLQHLMRHCAGEYDACKDINALDFLANAFIDYTKCPGFSFEGDVEYRSMVTSRLEKAVAEGNITLKAKLDRVINAAKAAHS